MKTTRYASPLGGILLAADDEGLIGAWFEGEKYFAEGLPADAAEGQADTSRLFVPKKSRSF